jgi:uncharacterized protein HemX
MTTRLELLLAMLVLLLMMAGAGFLYFQYSQRKIETLTAEVTAVRAQAAALTATNQGLQDDMARVKQLTSATDQRMNDIAAQANKVADTLAKHNLQGLASKKPKLIEDAINKSGNAFWSDVEAITR